MSMLRSFAQFMRHAPVLRNMTPVWDAVRTPYQATLNAFYGERGVPVRIAGHPLKLHPELVNEDWEHCESATYNKLLTQLRADDTFIDVGAYVGTYSILAASILAPNSRIVAYEPTDPARSYLKHNLRFNNAAEQVTVRHVCLGAEAGTADFYVSKDRLDSRNGLVEVEGLDVVTVPVSTLDAEVVELGVRPSFVKIDVEGAEWDVLQGASEVLKNDRPRLLLSLHPGPLAKQGRSAKDVLDHLSQFGYAHEFLGEDHEIHIFASVPDS